MQNQPRNELERLLKKYSIRLSYEEELMYQFSVMPCDWEPNLSILKMRKTFTKGTYSSNELFKILRDRNPGYGFDLDEIEAKFNVIKTARENTEDQNYGNNNLFTIIFFRLVVVNLQLIFLL
jgi:hypothetical protein